IFKDITPILKDGALFRASVDIFLHQLRNKRIDKSSASTRVGFFLVLRLPTSLASASSHCAKRDGSPIGPKARGIPSSTAKPKWSCTSTRSSATKKRY